MKEKDVVKRLRTKIKRNPQLAGKLAFELGYRSTNTITNWISRNSIPEYRITEVKELLKEIK